MDGERPLHERGSMACRHGFESCPWRNCRSRRGFCESFNSASRLDVVRFCRGGASTFGGSFRDDVSAFKCSVVGHFHGRRCWGGDMWLDDPDRSFSIIVGFFFRSVAWSRSSALWAYILHFRDGAGSMCRNMGLARHVQAWNRGGFPRRCQPGSLCGGVASREDRRSNCSECGIQQAHASNIGIHAVTRG